MHTYNKIWVAVGVPILAVGTALAMVENVGAAVLLFAFGAIAGAVIHLDREDIVHAEGRRARFAPRASRRTVGPALLGGLLLTGALGLALMDGQIFLGTALLAAITSPWVVLPLAGATRREKVPDYPLAGVVDIESAQRLWVEATMSMELVPSVDIESALAELPHLSDLEVCHAWRRSFVVLDSVSNPRDRLAVVQLREAYLDELDRRQPRALRAWLAAGGRAASGPDKYFRDAS